MVDGHCVGVPIVADMPHSGTGEMKDSKDCDRDGGSDAEYFDPARHCMGRCAARLRSCHKVDFGVHWHVNGSPLRARQVV
jgi:hypothetical protein